MQCRCNTCLQAELLRDLSGSHAASDILFIGKNENRRLVELITLQHSVQLLFRHRYSLSVCTVDHLQGEMAGLEVLEGAIPR